jgi:transcriptional regulator with XRE-family HTH domain
MEENTSLEFYLWKNRRTLKKKEFAKKVGISVMSLYSYVRRIYIPNLSIAMKIYYASDKQVPLESFLDEKCKKEIEEILNEKKPSSQV